MDQPEGSEPVVQFKISVPGELETGQFVDFLSVWSGPHAFTLDFGVTGQAQPGNDSVEVPVRVVARLNLPLTPPSYEIVARHQPDPATTLAALNHLLQQGPSPLADAPDEPQRAGRRSSVTNALYEVQAESMGGQKD